MSKQNQTKKKKKRIDIGSFFFHLAQIVILCVFIGTMVLFYQSGYIQKVVDLHHEAEEVMAHSSIDDFHSDQSGEVFDKNNKLIAYLRNDRNVSYLTSDAIPQEVKDAFISTEDKRFYRHHGFDPFALLRAAKSLLSKNSITQGGSTITQQLVRNIYLTHTVRWERKVEEIFIAIELEKKYSKDEILEFYINNIYFGNGYYGIQAASQGYFGKNVDELNLTETAFLCAIPNNPTLYDPLTRHEKTVKRCGLILSNMYKNGLISNADYAEATQETLNLVNTKPNFVRTYAHTYIYDCAVRALMEISGEPYDVCHDKLYTGGYRIYTSIDLQMQQQLQNAIDNTLSSYNTLNTNGTYALQSSAVCIDNETGMVSAIVGGRSQDSASVDYNRAFMSFRQPGSAIKPLIVYTPSLERNYTPDSIVMDSKEEDGPANAGNAYSGRISLRTAVEKSKNTVAYKLFRELTPEVGMAYLDSMNFISIKPSDYNLSSALGGLTEGVSALEMAAGYATLANEGTYRLPTCITMITDMEGNIIAMPERDEHPVYASQAAHQMTNILEGVLTKGTAAGKALTNMPCAGKTGTTNDNRDGWFVGYTPYYTTSVWVGFDSPRAVHEITGAGYPVTIWNTFMESVHQGLDPKPLAD